MGYDPNVWYLNKLQKAAYELNAKPARQLFSETKVGQEMTSYTHRLALDWLRDFISA